MVSRRMRDKFALLSVYDKTNIVELAQNLERLGYKIISTGGTSSLLKKNKIKVIPISEVTGNPESFDGRMKTISFQIESGILYDRSNKKHTQEASDLNIFPIDIVVCNLYPFEETISKKSVTQDSAIENIDVGGPTMIRAASKNYKHVLVLTDPKDYELAVINIKNLEFRKNLAAKAFYHLSYYDSMIANYFSEDKSPQQLTLAGRRSINLRYGENPHQNASVYLHPNYDSIFKNLKKVHGRDLSLTNLTDINAGFELVREFEDHASVIIKHNNPCGIALGSSISQALERSIDSDPQSAFGGVIVLNSTLDLNASKKISDFKKYKNSNIDIICCAKIDPEALKLLAETRKTIGVYTYGSIPKIKNRRFDIKWIDGGFVYQERDEINTIDTKTWTIVTKTKPNKKQFNLMTLAWKFLTRIRSNAILIMDPILPMTRGIGTGQTSRIRSVNIALEQAGKFTKNAVLASDSFFPFDDSVLLAAKAGIGAIIQQGGSINDQVSIDAADKAGIAMVFTNRRAFWH